MKRADRTTVTTGLRAAAALAMVASLLVGVSAPAGAAELPPGGSFVDDDLNVHQATIEAIAAAGITAGCNPPAHDRYCPDDAVTRGQMAAFLVRALDLPAAGSAGFTDTADSIHAADIDALAAAGITLGCNPPDNDRYCPTRPVTRGQMASFLTRALDLEPLTPPPAPFHLMASFTTHHNCCETRVAAVQSIADRLDGVWVLPGDTFSVLDRIGDRVQSGNCQTSTTLFNALYYAGLDEVEHRPHSVNFARYPDGIESTLIPGAVDLKFRNDTAHPLQIRTSYTGTSVTVELWGDNDGRSVVGDFTPATGTVLDVVNVGGPDARMVTSSVAGNGRTFEVTRTITSREGTSSETWSWTYAY
ncbi:MAG: VanW family protein [Acidimicrobiia bacterium]|jgi:hypothetical protein